LETAIYRIIQEALTNTIKYADASLIKIRLDYDQYNLAVTIQDDGLGFEQPTPSSSLGIISMHERAKMMSSELEIVSNSAGTKIVFNVPLKAD